MTAKGCRDGSHRCTVVARDAPSTQPVPRSCKKFRIPTFVMGTGFKKVLQNRSTDPSEKGRLEFLLRGVAPTELLKMTNWQACQGSKKFFG